MEARGPTAVDSIRLGAEHPENHWFIVYGADATRSVANRVAPPPPIAGLEFLNIGVVKFYDSASGQFGEMSIQDADHRIGPVRAAPYLECDEGRPSMAGSKGRWALKGRQTMLERSR